MICRAAFIIVPINRMTTMTFTIRTLDQNQAAARQEEIVAVYQAAFSEPPYNRSLAEAHLFRTSFSEHRYRAGFRLVGALQADSGTLVGFAYGYNCRPGQWWYERVRSAAGPDFGRVWLEGSFQVAEVAVQPRWQGHGAGTRLMEILMQDLPQPRAVLSTINLDTPASRLYRRLGWQVLLQPMIFPSVARPYKIMGIRLDRGPTSGA